MARAKQESKSDAEAQPQEEAVSNTEKLAESAPVEKNAWDTQEHDEAPESGAAPSGDRFSEYNERKTDEIDNDRRGGYGGDRRRNYENDRSGSDRGRPYENDRYGGDRGRPYDNNRYGDRYGGDRRGGYDNDRYGGDRGRPYDGDRYGGDRRGGYDNDRYGGDRGRPYENDRYGGDRKRFYEGDRYGGDRGRPYEGDRYGDDYDRPKRNRQLKEDPTEPNETIGVFNLSHNLTPRDFDEFLGERLADFKGKFTSKLIMNSQTGMCRGYGFVQFEDLEDAVKAKTALGEGEILGREYKVVYSIQRRGNMSDRPRENY